jgi:hypothetical protein
VSPLLWTVLQTKFWDFSVNSQTDSSCSIWCWWAWTWAGHVFAHSLHCMVVTGLSRRWSQGVVNPSSNHHEYVRGESTATATAQSRNIPHHLIYVHTPNSLVFLTIAQETKLGNFVEVKTTFIYRYMQFIIRVVCSTSHNCCRHACLQN